MKKVLGLASALLLAAACGDGPSGTAVQGSPAGVRLENPSAIYSHDDSGTHVVISDDANACAHLDAKSGKDHSVISNGEGGHIGSLELNLEDGHLLENATRTVGDDLVAVADPRDEADGGASSSVHAASGKGHLDHVDKDLGGAGAHADGDFDLTFPDGSHASGTFRALPCQQVTGGCASADGVGLLAFAALLGLGRRRRG